MESIGCVMPLENNMKDPRKFIGCCGVLYQGMLIVTTIYISLGFFGYLKYGDDIKAQIALNLPVEEFAAQAVKCCVSADVFLTFGLQFYVALRIAWNAIKGKVTKNVTLVNYIFRTFLVVAAVMLAIGIPAIKPFVGLLGAFCFASLGLLVPTVLEIITFWEQGFGPFKWMIWKNLLIFVFGFFALVLGTQDAIRQIIQLYQ
jgi:proton-coupled amino acid transporter